MTYQERIDINAHYNSPRWKERIKKGRHISPYHIPHLDKQSQIEKNAYDDCRFYGLAMYPEYQVGPYFLDLGNPALKVGIELDGKEWHTDTEKDRKRDQYLEARGWTVYRIEGSKCMKFVAFEDAIGCLDDPESPEYIRTRTEWEETTLPGLINKIIRIHGTIGPSAPCQDTLHDSADTAERWVQMISAK